jgi:hypothetical protein
MEPGVIAVIGLCVFLLLWYGGGHLYNRRRGRLVLRWLKAGLDVLGGEAEVGWLGSAAFGARINVTHAAPPFRRLEITLLLENREMLPLWLLRRLRGSQDWLIIRATLRSPRRGEVEVVPAGGRVAGGLRGEQERSWTWQERACGLGVAYQGTGAQRQVTALEPWLETYGQHLHRLSWRKTDPHIQLQMKVVGLLPTSSEMFLADLQAAVAEATHVDS